MFKTMEESIIDEVLKLIKSVGVEVRAAAPEVFSEGTEQPVYKNQKVKEASVPVPEVGRNDLCPCGSGKKYKKCHGA
jgi:preprotein translocase subunit SecA